MSTRDLVLAATFAALICALGLVPAIPLAPIPVPVTLQTLGVMLAGALLGPRRGAAAAAIVVALVAIGLPVLSGGRGGLGVLAGPTAGFLLGWIPGAAVTGIVTGWCLGKGRTPRSVRPGTPGQPSIRHSGAPKASPEPIDADDRGFLVRSSEPVSSRSASMGSGLSLREPRNDSGRRSGRLAAASFAGCLLGGIGIVYACGIAWLALVTGLPVAKAAWGVLLFLPGDVLKAGLAAAAVAALGRVRPLPL